MHLFVAGCPRSGTTILTKLLNLHPDIVIGMERYKLLYGKTRQLLPEWMEEKHFFDFKSGETNYTPENNEDAANFYHEARTKYPRAKFIGDKYPQFFRFYGKVFQAFPEARFVFIVRDPLAVGQSWQRRADDSSKWPAKNNALRSIEYWNDSLAYTLAYAQIQPGAFVFVEYEELFRRKAEGLADLLRSIGADTTPAILAQISRDSEPHFSKSGDILGRSIQLNSDVTEAIREAADLNLLDQVRKVIRVQRDSL